MEEQTPAARPAEKRQRNRVIHVRCDDAEHAAISELLTAPASPPAP